MKGIIGKMNIGVCASKHVGYELLKFVFDEKQAISFVITYEDDDYEGNIVNLCKQYDVSCYRGLDINSGKFINLNKSHSIDLIFMLWFPTIVKQPSLESVRVGFINLHPSYIPWNRGMHPYYWAIVDGSIAGTTIHFIDGNIDEGKILFQKEIDVSIVDTGESLYEKNLIGTIDFFKEKYDDILKSNYKLKEVDNSKGSFHLARELDKHSEIKLNKAYKAIDLINLMRARTFKNKGCSYFYLNGKKYKVRISIEESEN